MFNSKKRILEKNLIDKFDLIIDLQSKLRNTLILKQIPSNNFYSSTFNFKFCNKKRIFCSTKNEVRNIVLNIEKLIGIKIPFKKYSLSNIENKFFDEARKLLPDQNYVGFSITQGNEYRKKSWPLEKIINVAKQILKKSNLILILIKLMNQQSLRENYLLKNLKNLLLNLELGVHL